MNIMKKFKLSVDAGNISVVDYDYAINKWNANLEDKELFKIIKVEPGKYSVTISIPKSWNGKVEDTFEIYTTGELIVGDCCYTIGHGGKWNEFLYSTNNLSKSSKNFCSINTGGDGDFKVAIILKPIEIYDCNICKFNGMQQIYKSNCTGCCTEKDHAHFKKWEI